jgi:hypothetical protein
VDVGVRRRHGALPVELCVGGRIAERATEGLGVYLVQCVRRFDPWPKGIDVWSTAPSRQATDALTPGFDARAVVGG